MKRKYLFILPIIIFIIIILIFFFIIKPFTWGDNSNLILTISSNKYEMTINDTIEVKYSITNAGDNNVRILYPIGPQIQIFDDSNNSIYWIGPVMPPPPPPTNKDLHKLGKGQDISFNYIISKEYWDIHSNMTIFIIGKYISDDHEKIWLPFWKGELESNTISIKIL